MLRFRSKEQVVSYLRYEPEIHHLTVCYERTDDGVECRKGEGGEFAFFAVDSEEKVTKIYLIEGFWYYVLCFIHYAKEPIHSKLASLVCKELT